MDELTEYAWNPDGMDDLICVDDETGKPTRETFCKTEDVVPLLAELQARREAMEQLHEFVDGAPDYGPEALESVLRAIWNVLHDERLKPQKKRDGCGKQLASGQWWTFCGETDMGQTVPYLCIDCGGEGKLA